VLITGDCDAETWRYAIMEDYSTSDVKTTILMAAHHGSISFFDDPADTENYYNDHILAIKPAMTIISVGNNQHGHPDKKALELYGKYSSGSTQGNKVFTTQEKGTMKLTLKNDGTSLIFV
jgi:beta-lactamase superfamily II metal-dependent hydrolase